MKIKHYIIHETPYTMCCFITISVNATSKEKKNCLNK